MKKLVFLFAMVFVVSMAFAQKTTWVTQSGDYNTANVDQNACTTSDLTSVYATQSGDWNVLNSEQNGTSNYIELSQSGDYNTANMEQFTCGSPDLNTALLMQSGDNNTAILTQKEDPLDFPDNSNNTATMTQSGTSNNYTLKQGGNEWSPANEQFLRQSGDYNTANIDQLGITDYSEIRQTGDWNVADLNQTAGQGGAGTATSKSWQTGDYNTLDILQDYDSHDQIAFSTQNGLHNTTNIDQRSNGLQDVTSEQLGTSDVINVSQIGF